MPNKTRDRYPNYRYEHPQIWELPAEQPEGLPDLPGVGENPARFAGAPGPS